MASRSRTRHTGEQLGESERFGDVVVGARIETHDDVGFVAAGGQHDDREAFVLGAQMPADRETVTIGEREVEQDQVVVAARGVERVSAEDDVRDLESFALERPHQRLCDGGVVFDEEDRGHLRSVRLRSPILSRSRERPSKSAFR